MKFNKRLKELREAKGTTQNDMAILLKVSKSTYIKYERGEREPNYNVLEILSIYFNVSTDYLLGISDEKNIYINDINRMIQLLSDKTFMNSFGEYYESVQKLIYELMGIIYVLPDFHCLDILYILVQMEDLLIKLVTTGRHIFCYQQSIEEDNELKEVLLAPTPNDTATFIATQNDIRYVIDSFLKELIDKDYYINDKFLYEEQIKKYANIDIEELIQKIKFLQNSV